MAAGNLLGSVTGAQQLMSPVTSPRPAYFINNSPALPRSGEPLANSTPDHKAACILQFSLVSVYV